VPSDAARLPVLDPAEARFAFDPNVDGWSCHD